MKRKIIFPVLLICSLAALLSGCVGGLGGSDYARGEARQEQSVRTGVVERVREVRLEGTRSNIGTLAGGVAGGIGGAQVAHGWLGALGALAGAVGGGLVGQALEEGVTGRKGLEITVKLDNGSLVSVTQEADEEFAPGERVRIVSGGGVSRVTH
jgi:outer membrane lipoprotein SlyB